MIHDTYFKHMIHSMWCTIHDIHDTWYTWYTWCTIHDTRMIYMIHDIHDTRYLWYMIYITYKTSLWLIRRLGDFFFLRNRSIDLPWFAGLPPVPGNKQLAPAHNFALQLTHARTKQNEDTPATRNFALPCPLARTDSPNLRVIQPFF